MRWWRFVVLALLAVMAAAVASVVAVAINVATGGTAARLRWIEHHPWWWTAGATVAGAAAGLLLWRAQRWAESDLAALIPAPQRPEAWVVDRPDEVGRISGALRSRATVGITTAVHGTGGFGKTTVAQLVRTDQQVLRRFGGRVYWVTLGRDVRRGALVEKVNDLVRQVDPARAQPFTDVRQAADHLAAVLAAGPRRLIVLDDVWFDDQLAAFPVGGRCARLITTRVPSLLNPVDTSVCVDQMSQEQSRAVLTAGLAPLPPDVVEGLITVTGRWPLLLRLVNKVLLDQARLGAVGENTAVDLLRRLRRDGALQIDLLTGVAGQPLDVGDPEQRDDAVAATIEASVGLLSGTERNRLAELAIFAEDESIPVEVVALLWRTTGGLDTVRSGQLCTRLADLALLALTPDAAGGSIVLHDVVGEYLAAELGVTKLAGLHATLLDAAAIGLPKAPALSGDAGVTAWWGLDDGPDYLRDHLVGHLLAAARDAEQVATDVRWAGARLRWSGPAAPWADLVRVNTPRAHRLGRLLTRTIHLLAPTEPARLVEGVLYSRVSADADWGDQVRRLAADRPGSILVSAWPLPDLADAALRRALTGHTGPVRAVAIAPDGSWLASAGDDRTVRLWDPATGRQLRALTGHTNRIRTLAIAPNGGWLASGGDDGSVRIWDAATGACRATLTGNNGSVWSVVIAPDGSWLAAADADDAAGAVRVWDTDTWKEVAVHRGGGSPMWSVAVAPDGSWLAATTSGGLWFWEPRNDRRTGNWVRRPSWEASMVITPDGSGLLIGSLTGGAQRWAVVPASDSAGSGVTAELPDRDDHGVAPPWGTAVAYAPDGRWMATSGDHQAVQIWDTSTYDHRGELTGHTGTVRALAIAPDGTWLASGGDDHAVRIWDSGAVGRRPASPGRIGETAALAIAPDGTWLASAQSDVVVLRDYRTGHERARLIGHTNRIRSVDSFLHSLDEQDEREHRRESASARYVGRAGPGSAVRAVAIAPDGTWLASAGNDHTVRIWEAATGRQTVVLTGHTSWVRAVAIAPSGRWLASAGDDQTVRMWDQATGQQRAMMVGHTDRVRALAIAPDGRWLASAGDDHTVRLWEVESGKQLAIFAHPGACALAIAPDGAWLASGGSDHQVCLWDPATGGRRAELAGHTDVVRAVAISPDGAWVASTGDDQTIRIWAGATGRVAAMSRTEQRGHACAWHPSDDTLAVAGTVGLYKFDFR